MERTPNFNLDSDFEFLDSDESVKAQESRPSPNRLKPRERVFYARLGVAALSLALAATPMINRGGNREDHATKNTAVEAEMPDLDKNNPFKPVVERILASPIMESIPAMSETDTDTEYGIPVEQIAPDLDYAPEGLNSDDWANFDAEPTAAAAETNPATVWKGAVLNAHDGHIDGPSGDETYYNLPMDEIVARMHRLGVKGEYWVREDGVKMLGDYVMVAANLTTHPRGSIVKTSLGPGIVCDTGGFAEDHPNRLDIATNW